MMQATNSMIDKRRLGQTPLEITPIGLGAWQFSEGKGGAMGSWDPIGPEETDAIVAAALAGGINWFDTAELYGFGRSERGLIRGLQNAGKAEGEVVIATKWMPFFRWAGSIKSTISKRQAALSPYPIDLHQIHAPMSFSSIPTQMDAMADLIAAGKIRAAGISNFSAVQMRKSHERLAERGFPLASNQVEYSLLNRRIESNGVLDAAKALGVTIIAYSPLAMGLLSGKFHKDPSLLDSRPRGRRMRLRWQIEKSRALIAGLEEIGAAHGVTVSQVALNWLIHFHGEMVVAIPGATKVRHAEESAGAMAFRLSDDEMARIDELSQQFL